MPFHSAITEIAGSEANPFGNQACLSYYSETTLTWLQEYFDLPNIQISEPVIHVYSAMANIQ